MDLFHTSRSQKSDYELLRKFYGRDLGGENYFVWKHQVDMPLNGNKRVIHCEKLGEKIGIIFSTQYHFTYNNSPITINLIGDLGIDGRVKSPALVKHLLLSAHCFTSDASLCFSDDRKIAVYNAIFKRNLNTVNQIIAYDEVIIETLQTNVTFTPCSLDDIDFTGFKNSLGRKKDKNYLTYLRKHPGYQEIFSIQHRDMFAVLGRTDDFIEVLDISDTSYTHFLWAIRASYHFHPRCKILLPRHLTPIICHASGKAQESKSLNLMVSWYSSRRMILDIDNAWICRLDRR